MRGRTSVRDTIRSRERNGSQRMCPRERGNRGRLESTLCQCPLVHVEGSLVSFIDVRFPEHIIPRLRILDWPHSYALRNGRVSIKNISTEWLYWQENLLSN